MSQYSSPYVPPSVTPQLGVPLDALKPARRAGLIMFILGGLLLLMGSCDMIQAIVIPAEQAIERARQMQSMPQNFNLTPGQFKALTIVIAGLFLLAGAILVGLAIGVRRGGKVSTVLGLITTTSMLGILSLFAVVFLISAFEIPVMLAMVCLLSIPIAILVLLDIWLIAALRAQPGLDQVRQQQLMQYWQYQQNLQMYAGTSNQVIPQGYATASPTPPPLPPVIG